MTRKSIYSPGLINAAKALVINEDFHILMTEHIANLKVYTMDATEQADVLKAHADHNSMVEFVEYVRMLGTSREEPQQYD